MDGLIKLSATYERWSIYVRETGSLMFLDVVNNLLCDLRESDVGSWEYLKFKKMYDSLFSDSDIREYVMLLLEKSGA